ncbi:MAG TPA: hypothetical protein VK905_05265 [Bacillota bacterium]|nr:hypothetical protein [Bacillota bacterium]
MNISTDLWMWLRAASVLAIFSFLYKENPFYRFFEHIFVGAGAGWAIGVNLGTIKNNAWVPMTQNGRYDMLVPIILGILLYARFSRQYAWVARWPMSYMVGYGVGMSIYTALAAQLIAQTRASFIPLNSINNIIIVLGLLSCLAYFVFSFERNAAVSAFVLPGRYILMLTFGVSFGNVIMGRISLLLGQMQTLLGDWLGII